MLPAQWGHLLKLAKGVLHILYILARSGAQRGALQRRLPSCPAPNHPHNGAAVVDKPAKHARRAFAMRLQALALSRPAITPGGTTAATSSPVTSKRVRQPGLTGGAMAKAARVGGVG